MDIPQWVYVLYVAIGLYTGVAQAETSMIQLTELAQRTGHEAFLAVMGSKWGVLLRVLTLIASCVIWTALWPLGHLLRLYEDWRRAEARCPLCRAEPAEVRKVHRQMEHHDAVATMANMIASAGTWLGRSITVLTMDGQEVTGVLTEIGVGQEGNEGHIRVCFRERPGEVLKVRKVTVLPDLRLDRPALPS